MNKVFIKIILIYYILFIPSFGQSTENLEIKKICCFDGKSIEVAKFSSEKYSPKIEVFVKKILEASNSQPNFTLIPADVNLTVAKIEGGQREILYNQELLENLQKEGKDWVIFGILAHSIVHHLKEHSLEEEKRITEDFSVDIFVGQLLNKLGASQEDVFMSINFLLELEEKQSKNFFLTYFSRVAGLVERWKIENKKSENKICQFYDPKNLCGKLKNEYSNLCDEHYHIDSIVERQRYKMQRAKELLEQIKESWHKGDYAPEIRTEIDSILLYYPFSVEWIQEEISKLKKDYIQFQRLDWRRKCSPIFLKMSLSIKTEMKMYFLEEKYLECLITYEKFISLWNIRDFPTKQEIMNDLEKQQVLEDMEIFWKKTKIYRDFSEIPFSFIGIVYTSEHPENSLIIIDNKNYNVGDELCGAQILEIHEEEVLFLYQGENIIKRFRAK